MSENLPMLWNPDINAPGEQDLDDYLDEEVCCYCREPRRGRLACCGEVHYATRRELEAA